VIRGDDNGPTIKTFRSDDGEEIRVEIIRTNDGSSSQHRVLERILPRVQRDVRVERLHEDHGHEHGHDDDGDHPGLKVLREHLTGWRESAAHRTAPRIESVRVPSPSHAPRVLIREAIIPDAPALPRVLLRQHSAPATAPAPAHSPSRFRIHRTSGEAPAAAPGLLQRVLDGLGVHPAPAALPTPASPAAPAPDAAPAWPLRLPAPPPAPAPADDGTIIT
jgi:hypothetical protein